MTYFKKAILQGTDDAGDAVNIPVTQEGHMEVALHAPRLPFGAIHTENLRAVFQADGVYGVNSTLNNTGVSGTGSLNTREDI